MNKITVLPVGTRIMIGDGGIEAVVVGICVTGPEHEHVTYHAAWWAGRERREEWVNPLEIDQVLPRGENRKLLIGFNDARGT